MDLPRVVLDFPYLAREKAEEIEFKPEKLATMIAAPVEKKFLNVTDELREVIFLANTRADLNEVSRDRSTSGKSSRRGTFSRISYNMEK